MNPSSLRRVGLRQLCLLFPWGKGEDGTTPHGCGADRPVNRVNGAGAVRARAARSQQGAAVSWCGALCGTPACTAGGTRPPNSPACRAAPAVTDWAAQAWAGVCSSHHCGRGHARPRSEPYAAAQHLLLPRVTSGQSWAQGRAVQQRPRAPARPAALEADRPSRRHRLRSPTSPEQCQGHGQSALRDRTEEMTPWHTERRPDQTPSTGCSALRPPRPPFCSRARGSGTRCSAPPGSRSSAGGRPAAWGGHV